MMRTAWVLCMLAFGCASDPAFSMVRFANAPPATIVDDRRDVPRPPEERVAMQDRYAFEVLLERPIDRTFGLARTRRAQDVNSIDEVPDSTWFTNRGPLTPEQMRTGPLAVDTPEQHFPWRIESTKFGGISLGFMIRDARGIKWLLKLEHADFPEVRTGADVVTDRLLWAAGYNVPEDAIVYFRAGDLELAPGAKRKGRLGADEGPLTAENVRQILALAERDADGRYRAIASRWLDGKPAGDPGSEATRRDDPNDRIPHELHRDRRGLGTFYAWVDMADVWPGNFLDMWIDDHGRHYFVHYVLDFDSSLTALGSTSYDKRRGRTYRWDWPAMSISLASAGLVRWSWEHRPTTAIRGVPSLFSSVGFDPGHWRCDLPYLPFQVADRFDAFWAAKIMARFSREQIRAAVEAARYSDPRATEYVTDTLVARQHAIVAYAYRRVNPLDHFEMSDRLCFDDLAIAQGYAGAATTRYAITAHDARGRALSPAIATAAAPDGRTCVPVPALANAPDNYTIVEITTARPELHGTTYVHLARDRAGVLRVVGIWRV